MIVQRANEFSKFREEIIFYNHTSAFLLLLFNANVLYIHIRPSSTAKDAHEKKMGRWIGTQHQNAKEGTMALADVDKREKWEEMCNKYAHLFVSLDDIWYSTYAQVEAFMDAHNRRPSTIAKDAHEKKMGAWIGTQQTNAKEGKYALADADKRTKWEEMCNKYAHIFNTKNTTIKKKSTTLVIPKPKDDIANKTHTSSSQRRPLPEISQLHKKYITMNSRSVSQMFVETPSLWTEYHDAMARMEEGFETNDIPRNRMIAELNKVRSARTKTVIDLGCGRAQLATHFGADKRFQFFNYNHIVTEGLENIVTQCDISSVPHEDASVDIVVLSLAMWGSNCSTYISEAHRVLDGTGRLYIVEATKRWTVDGSTECGGRLRSVLEEKGFSVICESVDKWCMFICTPNCV